MNTRQYISQASLYELALEEIRFMAVQATRCLNGERIRKYDEVDSLLIDIRKYIEIKVSIDC